MAIKVTKEQIRETGTNFTQKCSEFGTLTDDLTTFVGNMFSSNDNPWIQSFQGTWNGVANKQMKDIKEFFTKYATALQTEADDYEKQVQTLQNAAQSPS